MKDQSVMVYQLKKANKST